MRWFLAARSYKLRCAGHRVQIKIEPNATEITNSIWLVMIQFLASFQSHFNMCLRTKLQWAASQLNHLLARRQSSLKFNFLILPQFHAQESPLDGGISFSRDCAGSIYEVVAVLAGWVFNQNPIIRQSVCLNDWTATNFTATSTGRGSLQAVRWRDNVNKKLPVVTTCCFTQK